uniref:Death ligand signal enhancer n=1 Tax=Oncorhynchus kisutch TaxID=8019 RepID=A0A8C7MJ19_ONCKI
MLPALNHNVNYIVWRRNNGQGLLHRCHGNAPLRLSQNHHVEDEVIHSSTFLSTGRHSPDSSSQKGEDGDKWRVHSRVSSGAEPNPNTGCLAVQDTASYWRLSRCDVLPRGRSVSCLPQRQQAQQRRTSVSSNGYSSSDQLHGDVIADGFLADCHHSSGREEASFSKSSHPEDKRRARKREAPPQQNEQDALAGAAQNLQQVADSSVSVVLNIIGLESAKTGDYDAAFSCFLATARRGYCKAQFNTGVCYKKGRGVGKDGEKALHFYSQAASGGHSQSQYRCAKLLLSSRGQQSTQKDLDSAISLLQQAASAGLKEAQVYLGSLFSQEPVRDGRKSVHYLKMAAESGDSEALLFLGQCYESGFGVPQCFRTAVGFYQRAAQAGSSQAKTLLTPPCGVEDAVLRSIRSCPCFSVSDRLREPLSTLPSPVLPSSGPTLPLPHSWSTGSMGPPPPSLPLHPPSFEGNAVRWTLVVG